MSARRREVAAGLSRGRRLVVDLSRELDDARRASGLSYAAMGRAIGLSGDQIARICRAESPNVSLVRLATLLSIVGLELSARPFPAGSPIRDKAHVALLSRLHGRLARGLGWRLEVPVVSSAGSMVQGFVADRRAWDAVIDGDGWSIGVEAETRLGDVQALLRKVALKRRDGEADGVLLLVNDTAGNRRVLALEGSMIAGQFSATTREALRNLGRGVRPAGDAVVVI